jgi:DNA-binding NarL/FixJ family response regulator
MNYLVAEDDPFHRSFLKSTLMNTLEDCETIYEAIDGQQALAVVNDNPIDGIVMDLQMPRANGVETATEIWRNRPDMRILFWSNYADEAYVRGISRIVPNGAVYGYLLKTASEDRLELAVRGVFREDQCIIDREVRGVQQRTENNLEGLSDSEFEVLLDIALGMTDKAIAFRRRMSTRGVQSRLKHLYDKLGIDQSVAHPDYGPIYNSRTRAVAIALSRGLLNAQWLSAREKEYEAWLKSSGNMPEE